MPIQYRALRRLKVGDGYREPGDLVPEAHHFSPNALRVLLDNKHLQEEILVDALHPAPHTTPVWASGSNGFLPPEQNPPPAAAPVVPTIEPETQEASINAQQVNEVAIGREGRYAVGASPSAAVERRRLSESPAKGSGRRKGRSRSRSGKRQKG